jgi:hypothetical protein
MLDVLYAKNVFFQDHAVMGNFEIPSKFHTKLAINNYTDWGVFVGKKM